MPACRRHIPQLLFGVVGALLFCVPAYAQDLSNAPGDEKALDTAVRELCTSQVAMLGEAATHGDGHTLTFKVALVERLVDRCGFDAVVFEASQAEFINLNQRIRSREAVTPDDLLNAVGGLWKFYREFPPLANFLLARARSGKVLLGGLDDQLEQVGQSYANDKMTAEFTSLLPAPEQQGCNPALHRRIYYDYPADKPYLKLDQVQRQTCLTEIDTAAHADQPSPAEQEKTGWRRSLRLSDG